MDSTPGNRFTTGAAARPEAALAFALLYVVLGLVGRSTTIEGTPFGLVWPAGGVAVLWFLVRGARALSVDTGLGLSICRRSFSRHGGTIVARDNPAGPSSPKAVHWIVVDRPTVRAAVQRREGERATGLAAAPVVNRSPTSGPLPVLVVVRGEVLVVGARAAAPTAAPWPGVRRSAGRRGPAG